MSLMLKSVYAEHDRKPLPILCDIGYWLDSNTGKPNENVIARFEAFRAAGIPRTRCSFEGSAGRVFVEIPPTKLAKLMTALPIIEGSTYWRATHHWRGLAVGETE